MPAANSELPSITSQSPPAVHFSIHALPKDQQQYVTPETHHSISLETPRTHQTISTAEDPLDAEIGSLTESGKPAADHSTQNCALLPNTDSGQIQWN